MIIHSSFCFTFTNFQGHKLTYTSIDPNWNIVFKAITLGQGFMTGIN